MGFTLAYSDFSFTIPERKGIGKCPKKTSLRESTNRQQSSDTSLAPLVIEL